MSEQNGHKRVLSLDQVASERNARDEQGRLMRTNATIREAHEIAIEEGNKVHSFYMDQIPPFVARMIQDALMSYGLITLTEEALAAAPKGDVVTIAEEPAKQPEPIAQAEVAERGDEEGG